MQPLLATLQADDETIQGLRARVHQLEEMLAAVGAGGVEPLMQAASSKHVEQHLGMVSDGWKLVPVEPTKEMLDAYVRLQVRFNSARSDWAAMLAAAPQLLKSTTSMSSTKPDTDYQVEQLAHRTCWHYRHSPDPAHSHTYTFNRHTLLDFARALREGGAA